MGGNSAPGGGGGSDMADPSLSPRRRRSSRSDIFDPSLRSAPGVRGGGGGDSDADGIDWRQNPPPPPNCAKNRFRGGTQSCYTCPITRDCVDSDTWVQGPSSGPTDTCYTRNAICTWAAASARMPPFRVATDPLTRAPIPPEWVTANCPHGTADPGAVHRLMESWREAVRRRRRDLDYHAPRQMLFYCLISLALEYAGVPVMNRRMAIVGSILLMELERWWRLRGGRRKIKQRKKRKSRSRRRRRRRKTRKSHRTRRKKSRKRRRR